MSGTHLKLVVINETAANLNLGSIEFYVPEVGISKTELIKDIFNQKLEQGYKYFLNWPSGMEFQLEAIQNIYHEVKRGFDIVIAYNQFLKHQPGCGYRLWFRCLTWFKIQQPYSDLYCFNWFVVQQFIKNERLLIEPSVYLFFQLKLHLKILSLGLKYEIPLVKLKHGGWSKMKQDWKLFYYLFIFK